MQRLADEHKVRELVDAMAQWLGDRVSRGGGWAVVGIRSRGDVVARRVTDAITRRQGPRRLAGRVGCLDITLYRDDLSEASAQPVVRTTEVPFSVDGLDVVLVDDVLMTGRSARAALQSLMDLGRPRRVWLAVLVDRGGRELPIAADFAAMDLTGQRADAHVRVMVQPTDDRDAILLEPGTHQEAPA